MSSPEELAEACELACWALGQHDVTMHESRGLHEEMTVLPILDAIGFHSGRRERDQADHQVWWLLDAGRPCAIMVTQPLGTLRQPDETARATRQATGLNVPVIITSGSEWCVHRTADGRRTRRFGPQNPEAFADMRAIAAT